MEQLAVLPTAIITLGAVVIISFVASRLESLPVDFAAAGISLVLLFVEAAGQTGGGTINNNHSIVWSVALALSFSAFLIFFTLVTFGGTRNASKRVDKVSKETGWDKDFIVSISYFLSLSIASFFVLGAVSLASNVRDVLSIDILARGGVAHMFGAATRDLPRLGVSLTVLLLVASTTFYTRSKRKEAGHE